MQQYNIILRNWPNFYGMQRTMDCHRKPLILLLSISANFWPMYEVLSWAEGVANPQEPIDQSVPSQSRGYMHVFGLRLIGL